MANPLVYLFYEDPRMAACVCVIVTILLIICCSVSINLGKESCENGYLKKLSEFWGGGHPVSWVSTLIPFFWPLKSAALVSCKTALEPKDDKKQ